MIEEDLYLAQVAILKPLHPTLFDGDSFRGDDNDIAVLIARIAKEMRDAGKHLLDCYKIDLLAGPEFFNATWDEYTKAYGEL